MKDFNRIDGEPKEIEWKIFPGFTTFGFLEQIQKIMKEQQCDPEQFKGRIIFMSMFTDIIWGEKENEEKCKSNAREGANCALRFPSGDWSFLGPGSKNKWYGTHSDMPDGVWDETAEKMMSEFSENRPSDIPCFQRPYKRRITKQRRRHENYPFQR